MKKRLVKLLRLLIIFLSVAFILIHAWGLDYNAISISNFNLYFLSFSIFLSLTFRLLLSLIWNRSIYFFSGKKPDYRSTLHAYAVSWIARYIPGGVFSIISRSIINKRIEMRHSLSASLFEVILQILALATSILIILLLLNAKISLRAQIIPGSLATLILAIALLFPYFSHNFQMRIYEITKLDLRLSTSRKLKTLTQLPLYFLSVNIGSASFVMLILSIIPSLSTPNILNVYSVYLVLSLASTLIFIVPAGIGIREAGLTFFLTPIIGAELALLISISSRIWTIACDCLFYLLSLAVKKR
ncbi:hypothetical protein EZI54_08710 [Marinobacter halodurans]|uniref:Flippase-like domain-containing protein n=1 Tax=Marinobacter halodurans TaxID=2528979 RepID=A0ABY1ZLQ2_9GAMM|nr:hypothetical protein EZI54_08710 [Marinobacter halodurans]